MKSYTLQKEDFLGEDKEFNSVTAKQALSTDHLFSCQSAIFKPKLFFFAVQFTFRICPMSDSQLPSEYLSRHDKTDRVSVRPAKTQISLGIRPVRSESLLPAWRKLGSLATH